MRDVVLIEHTGGPEMLELRSVPTPDPAPDELLVDVAAAGVNYIDTYQRSGKYEIDLPYVLGGEGSGRVSAVGADVDLFAVGDRVAWTMNPGSYATQAVVRASAAAPIPDDIDDRTAAAVFTQGLTAHFLTYSIAHNRPGDTVLVHAGAGGVGLLLTQMLVHEGVRVISTVSTAEKADASRAAGAEPLVGYDGFADRVRELTDGVGARVVYDGVGRTTFAAGLDALAPRGTMVLFGAASGPVAPVDPQTLNRKGSLKLTRPSIVHFVADRAEFDDRATDVFNGVASGDLKVHIDAAYPLAEAATAHRALEGRQTTGKLLLIP